MISNFETCPEAMTMAGQSLLSVAAWWVAWVYALSLSLPLLLPAHKMKPPTSPKELFENWAREVVFKQAGLTVSEIDADGLTELVAVATSPAPIADFVPVRVEPWTASPGIDFEVAESGLEIHFERGAVEGKVRVIPGWGPGVRIVAGKEWKPSRSFRLWLQSGRTEVAAGDRAMCTVTISDDADKPINLGSIGVEFARDKMRVPRSALATTAIDVEAEAPVAKPVPIAFELSQTIDGRRRSLGTFARTLPTGERRLSFRLADAFPAEELERLGLNDDGLLGLDETYELQMDPERPLFPGTGVETCELVVENSGPPPSSRLVYFDRNKREVEWLDPEGYVTVEYDGPPLRNRSTHFVTIDGRRLPGEVVIGPRDQRGSLVPLADHDWRGREGRRCGVAGQCGSGCCKGQGGCSGKAVCGEPVPGDYMLIVVNNERLHDPDNRIVEQVRKALADESAKPYGNGAIILNPTDEDTLTPKGGGPDPAKVFQPFDKEGHDVAGQLKRIEEVVARKREAAANPDLRAVVVWPERDLAAESGIRPVQGADLKPMSILLPDARASYARDVERGLLPPGVLPGEVTVRAPGERELEAHLVNVIAEGDADRDAESTP
jgi:hypothetical protein